MADTTPVKSLGEIPTALKIKTSHYIIVGFSIATAIAWNKSIGNAIEQAYPLPKDQVNAGIAYAMIMTIILVIIIYLLPDTKTILPADTQHKINDETEKEELRAKVAQLENRMNGFTSQRFS